MGAPATSKPVGRRVPALPGPPRSPKPGRKYYEGYGRFVIPRTTYHPDGRVKAGYGETPYSAFLMPTRTRKPNVIGLCYLVCATTYGTKGIGDYVESVLTIDDIQGYLKCSPNEASPQTDEMYFHRA